jgi:hypothetical protein
MLEKGAVHFGSSNLVHVNLKRRDSKALKTIRATFLSTLCGRGDKAHRNPKNLLHLLTHPKQGKMQLQYPPAVTQISLKMILCKQGKYVMMHVYHCKVPLDPKESVADFFLFFAALPYLKVALKPFRKPKTLPMAHWKLWIWRS